jgi:ABC-type multidrug transport system permease subunit
MTEMAETIHEPKRSGVSALSQFHRTKLVFLIAAFLSFLFSVFLWFFVDRELGLFVGLWVPAIHSLGTLVLVGEDQ